METLIKKLKKLTDREFECVETILEDILEHRGNSDYESFLENISSAFNYIPARQKLFAELKFLREVEDNIIGISILEYDMKQLKEKLKNL